MASALFLVGRRRFDEQGGWLPQEEIPPMAVGFDANDLDGIGSIWGGLLNPIRLICGNVGSVGVASQSSSPEPIILQEHSQTCRLRRRFEGCRVRAGPPGRLSTAAQRNSPPWPFARRDCCAESRIRQSA